MKDECSEGFRVFVGLFKAGLGLLLGVLVENVSHEGDFKEAVGTFLVPEGVGGRDSALSLSGVEIDTIDDRLVSLREAREFGSKLVNGLSSPGSNVKRNGGV